MLGTKGLESSFKDVGTFRVLALSLNGIRFAAVNCARLLNVNFRRCTRLHIVVLKLGIDDSIQFFCSSEKTLEVFYIFFVQYNRNELMNFLLCFTTRIEESYHVRISLINCTYFYSRNNISHCICFHNSI